MSKEGRLSLPPTFIVSYVAKSLQAGKDLFPMIGADLWVAGEHEPREGGWDAILTKTLFAK